MKIIKTINFEKEERIIINEVFEICEKIQNKFNEEYADIGTILRELYENNTEWNYKTRTYEVEEEFIVNEDFEPIYFDLKEREQINKTMYICDEISSSNFYGIGYDLGDVFQDLYERSKFNNSLKMHELQKSINFN